MYVQPASLVMFKVKVFMMPVLIQGPKQPSNDIDVYLKPLVYELLQLGSEGVCMWDKHKKTTLTYVLCLF
jgi:hypothetical protein